jgi:hypothetical protein
MVGLIKLSQVRFFRKIWWIVKMIVKLNLQVQLPHPWSWLCMGSLARHSDKYCMTSGAYIHALLVWSTSAVLKGKLCPVGGRRPGDVRTYFSNHFLALYYKVGGGGAISYPQRGCSSINTPIAVHELSIIQIECMNEQFYNVSIHIFSLLRINTFMIPWQNQLSLSCFDIETKKSHSMSINKTEDV